MEGNNGRHSIFYLIGKYVFFLALFSLRIVLNVF